MANVDRSDNVWLWDLQTGRQIGKLLATSIKGPAYSIAFSPDGQFLAVGGWKGRVWLGDTRHDRGHSFKDGSGPVYSIAFSPDSHTIAAGTVTNSDSGLGGGTLRLWDVTTGDEVGRPLPINDGGTSVVAFTSDGDAVASARADGIVQLWDITNGKQVGPALPSAASFVDSVAFSPDGHHLAALEDGCKLRLWTLPSRALTHTARTITCPSNLTFSRFPTLIGTGSVAFSPNGRVLATAGNVGPLKYEAASQVRLWDAATGHLIATLPVTAVYAASSPDGRTLAVITKEGLRVQLWDMVTHRRMISFTCNIATALAFSPNGHTLAVGGRNCNVKNRLTDKDSGGRVLLWSMITHRQIGFLKTPGFEDVSSVAFSPSGRILATAQGNNAVRIWNVATGRQIGTLLPSQTSASVKTLAFSRDGRTLAGGGSQGRTWLWDVATNRQIGPPLLDPAHANIVALAFSPGGRMLATGGLDGHVRLWNIAFLAKPASSICTSTGRSLTRTEWGHYAPGVPYRQICPQN